MYIEGQLRTRTWDQNGEKRYTTEVVLSGFNSVLQMLNKVTGEPQGEPETGDLEVAPEKIQPVDNDGFEDDMEDIPF